jgi:hypothetical protein
MVVRTPGEIPVVEPTVVPDVPAEGCVRIDRLTGGNCRLVFYTVQVGPDGGLERAIVAKIFMHESALPALTRLISEDAAEMAQGRKSLQ